MTTLIYYLGYARYLDLFPPARHLDNLLVDPHKCIIERKQIKVSRRNQKIQESSSDSDNESLCEIESLSNFAVFDNTTQFKRKKLIEDQGNKKYLRCNEKKKIAVKKPQNKRKIRDKKLSNEKKNAKFVIPNIETRPVKLSLNEQQLRDGDWLTDIEISEFLVKLKEFNQAKKITVNGLNDPIYLSQSYLVNHTHQRKESFVEVIFSRGNHWICIESGILNKDNEKGIISIFDSMSRTSIDNMLGTQCSLIVPTNFVKNNLLTFRVAKTQNQKFDFCGYFALAYAMAICLDINPENIYFDENDIRNHYIDVMLNNKQFSMFPYILKQKTYKKKPNYITYTVT